MFVLTKVTPSLQQRAFTLIELLVVITIIALLAAILFPVFSRARENARRSACQSNLKQMGLAIQQYTQDYDEFFPVGHFTTNTTSLGARMHAGHGWATQVQPYVKNWQVFRCPSDNTRPAGSGHRIYSYAYNIALAWGPGSAVVSGTPICKPAKDSLMNASSKTVMLTEVRNVSLNITSLTEASTPVTNGRGAAMRSANNDDIKFATGYIGPFQYDNEWDHFSEPEGRHFTGANYLMADGHVKWYKGIQVSPGHTAASSTSAPNGNDYYGSTVAGGTEYNGTYAVTYSLR